MLEELATQPHRIDRVGRNHHLHGALDRAAGGRHRDDGVAVRHEEAHARIPRAELGGVEDEHGRLQEPAMGRAPRVQHAQHALVVGQRAGEVCRPPPARVGEQGQAELLVVEIEAVDHDVFDRTVPARDVADVVALRHGETARIGRLGGRVGRGHRVQHLPGPLVAELRVDAEQIVQGRGAGSRQPEHGDRTLHGRQGPAGVVRVPGFDPQPIRQTRSDEGLQGCGGIGVVAELRLRHRQQAIDPDLPTVRTQVGQAGLTASPLHQLVTRRNHVPQPWDGRRG